MGRFDTSHGFTNVDQTADPGRFVYYLDAVNALEAAQAYKRQTFALLDVRQGAHLLDLGCGNGDDARALAQLVGEAGRVVGLDSSAVMVTEARQRAERLGLRVEYRVGDAHHLDFPDGSFDGCRADRVFMHLDDPRRALAEMVRVARAGARVVVSEPDWETLVVDVPARALTRTVLNAGCESYRDGWIGRRLPSLFKEAGLVDIRVVPATVVQTDYALASEIFSLGRMASQAHEAGAITAAEAAAWLSELAEAGRAGRFFSAITGFIVGGRKP